MKISNEKIPVKVVAKEVDTTVLKNDDFLIRDPFILLYGDKYYMYLKKDGKLCAMVSDDLLSWSEPIKIFNPPADFYGVDNFFWAPECHYYKGKFYIFTSCFSAKTKKRRISTYVADNPLGPFVENSIGGITAEEYDAIDGTLYIDGDGVPYMVYVREWTSMPDKIGSFEYARLSEDFTHFVTTPKHMFYASALTKTSGVTDGCYMLKLDSGKLCMLWSTFLPDETGENAYIMALASSSNGALDGEWSQDKILYQKNLRPDYDKDGGHGMLFRDKNGELILTYHSPNGPYSESEKVAFRKVTETVDGIEI